MARKRVTPILAILILGASLCVGRESWGEDLVFPGHVEPIRFPGENHIELKDPAKPEAEKQGGVSTVHGIEEKQDPDDEKQKSDDKKAEENLTKTIEENTDFKATGTYADGRANSDIFYDDGGKYLVSDGKLYYAEDGVTYNHLDGTQFKETNLEGRNTIQIPENFNPPSSPRGGSVIGGGSMFGGGSAPSVDGMLAEFSADGAYGAGQPALQTKLRTYLEGLTPEQRTAFNDAAKALGGKCEGCNIGFTAEKLKVDGFRSKEKF